eukprot:190168_1
MVVLLSPAKTLNWGIPELPRGVHVSQPCLWAKDAKEMCNQVALVMKSKTKSELKKLLGISNSLAELNHQRYKELRLIDDELGAGKGESDSGNVFRPAAYAFDGPAYQGMDVRTLTADDIHVAQRQLWILDGLYGMLRPLDCIQPYRLEMATKLRVGDVESLSLYWRDAITEVLLLENGKEYDVIINLASMEYAKAIDFQRLRNEGRTVIDCVFLHENRLLAVFAKRARGLMARHIFRKPKGHSILDWVKCFNDEGYHYDASKSDDKRVTFDRKDVDKPAPVKKQKQA